MQTHYFACGGILARETSGDAGNSASSLIGATGECIGNGFRKVVSNYRVFKNLTALDMALEVIAPLFGKATSAATAVKLVKTTRSQSGSSSGICGVPCLGELKALERLSMEGREADA